MDWRSLFEGMKLLDKDLPERAARLRALRLVLDGAQYDHLPNCFQDEKSPGGEYVPLRQRRPSVRSNLARTVVDDTVSLLFGDGHFPTILVEDEPTRQALVDLCAERRLNEVMMDAATRGSVGSIALRLRILRNKVFIDALDTPYLTPEWRDDDPDTLASVTEKYKVSAKDLIALGYKVDPDAGDHWFERIWTDQEERAYRPYPVVPRDGKAPVKTVDPDRSITHGLGFVPVIWVKNLPGGAQGSPDGVCTFERAIDTICELDYLMSQGGRGLKYASDPTLVLKTSNDESTPQVGGAANALIVPPEGDAQLLEINGSAAAAVIKHAQELRTIALEMMHGNRAHPDKMTAAQSGRAMELLNQGLVWLAGKLRTSYGEGALLALLKMVCAASQRVNGGLTIGGKPNLKLMDAGLSLKWPDWYPPTADDRMAEVNALAAGLTAGVMSRESAVLTTMEFYDIPDLKAELSKIEADMAAADARLVSQAAKVTAAETVPGA
jgi:hypothetical protein